MPELINDLIEMFVLNTMPITKCYFERAR